MFREKQQDNESYLTTEGQNNLTNIFICAFSWQFLAANDKLLFWLELSSIVDFFTVPQVFVSIVVEQTWVGKLKFSNEKQTLWLF